MRVVDSLSPERVRILDAGGLDKSATMQALAELLSPAAQESVEVIARRLMDRETVQSTGIGQGVAIPHTSLPSLSHQLAAMLIAPGGVPFGAMDGVPATLIVGVLGPSQGASDHLKFLARLSRLFRSAATRKQLTEATSPEAVLSVIERVEGGF